jgi:hypothetical protein
VARGNRTPGLPQNRNVTVSCHSAFLIWPLQNSVIHAQWANSPGSRCRRPYHQRFARLNALSRLNFLRAQRTRGDWYSALGLRPLISRCWPVPYSMKGQFDPCVTSFMSHPTVFAGAGQEVRTGRFTPASASGPVLPCPSRISAAGVTSSASPQPPGS